MNDIVYETVIPLTRAQKAAATRAEKKRVELEAMRRYYEERQREREAEDVIRRAEDRRFWIGAQAALLELGCSAPVRSGRKTFAHAGCVAIILGIIAEGNISRDDILSLMRHDYRYSYRHAGFLLSQLCGPDPEQHLWYKDEERHYRLHHAVQPKVASLAA